MVVKSFPGSLNRLALILLGLLLVSQTTGGRLSGSRL